MIAALRHTALEDRKDPPKALTYLFTVVLVPCLTLTALWTQGNLTFLTGSIALSVTAFVYINMETIQNCVRPIWRREYEAKLARLEARLLQPDLSGFERRQILGKIQDLNDRHHLVTNPSLTYSRVDKLAIVMRLIAKVLRLDIH